MDKWTMPMWMHKYKKFIRNTENKNIEKIINDEVETHLSTRSRVLDQIHLLESLNKNGLLR